MRLHLPNLGDEELRAPGGTRNLFPSHCTHSTGVRRRAALTLGQGGPLKEHRALSTILNQDRNLHCRGHQSGPFPANSCLRSHHSGVFCTPRLKGWLTYASPKKVQTRCTINTPFTLQGPNLPAKGHPQSPPLLIFYLFTNLL